MKQYEKLLAKKDRTIDNLAIFSFTDYLTGCYNMLALELWFRHYKASDLNFSLVFLDINSFKKINQNLGHQQANTVLRAFATLLKGNFAQDIVARFGGDEFVIITSPHALEARFNQFAETSFLSFAYGHVLVSQDADNLGYLISTAEKNMKKF